MIAIVLCALAVSADVEPQAPKAPPRLILVKLDGDRLVSRVTVTEVVPVTRKVEVNNNGKIEVREVTAYETRLRVVEHAIETKKATITTAGGKKLSLDDLKKRLAKPQVVVVSGDGKPIDEAYLKVLDRDAIVIVPEAAK